MIIWVSVVFRFTNNSLSKDYPHPDDYAKQITDTPLFKPFAIVVFVCLFVCLQLAGELSGLSTVSNFCHDSEVEDEVFHFTYLP